MIRAVTSASNMHRRAVCPGSEHLEAGLRDEESTDSKEGTLLHSCYAGAEGVNLTPDQRDLLKIALEADDTVRASVVSQFGISDLEPHTQGHEQELWIHRGIRAVLSGHCDRWIYFHRIKLLVIIDQKFGFKPVTPAVANYQLRTYAVAGAEQWPADNVVVAISQPRLSRDERVTIASYTVEDLRAAKQELLNVLAAASKPDAPLQATEDGCRYCKAKLLCPAYKTKFLTIAEMGAKDLALCTDQDLDQILVAIQFADFICEQARDEARRRVASGALPTWKLGKASEVRKVVDPEKAIALLTMGGTLSREEVLACSAPSLKKLEDKVREKTGGTWKHARETIDATLAPVIERTEKKASLTRVKESADRPMLSA